MRRLKLAGFDDAATALVATAEHGPLTDLERVLAVRMRALIAWDARPDYAATLQLLDAARQLEPYDVDLARDASRGLVRSQ